LKRLGLRVVCLEAADSPGGCIRTLKKDGFLFELGPNTVLDNAPELGALCDAAGVAGERIAASPLAKKRFVVKGGKLVALPGSLGAFIRTRLFSLGAKMRILREPFVARAPESAEESIADFARRRLGPDLPHHPLAPSLPAL